MSLLQGSVKTSTGGGADGEPRPLPDAGQQAAVIVGLVDLGTHEDRYNEGKKRRRLLVVFELTGEPVPGTDHNHVLGKEVTLSFHEKSNLVDIARSVLRIKGADAEDISFADLLGKPCSVEVEHGTAKSGMDFARIKSVGGPIKGIKTPAPKRKRLCWMMESDGNWELKQLPEWLPFVFGRPVPDIVRGSEEWAERQAGAARTAPKAAAKGAPKGDDWEAPEEPDSDSPF